MAINLNTVMDALGTALGSVTNLRVYDYQADAIAVPAAVVGLPDELTYDNTMARGTDAATFPVHLMVGKVSDRAARDKLAGYCDGTGAASVSVKAALDALKPAARVQSVSFGTVTVGGIEYLAATFEVHYVA